MYVPPAFRESDPASIHEAIRASGLAQLVTATAHGILCTPLPLFLDVTEGEKGTLYGHVAKANPQSREAVVGEALAIFMGPDAYVSPSWYESKRRDGKVVPTWNYLTVHAHGPVEFFDDAERLLDVVTRLTDRHEASRPDAWSIADAPADFVRAQLKGIVGLRMPIARIEAKRKASQNRNAEDRAGVKAGLAASDRAEDRRAADLVRD
jgi:transcriptional regulator